jgi:hypothetical protein
MVDAIPESLVVFHLPSEIETVGLGTYVAKIRNENRNISAHFIREPNDLHSFYRAALYTLTTACFYVFQYPAPPSAKLSKSRSNGTQRPVLGELKAQTRIHQRKRT